MLIQRWNEFDRAIYRLGVDVIEPPIHTQEPDSQWWRFYIEVMQLRRILLERELDPPYTYL